VPNAAKRCHAGRLFDSSNPAPEFVRRVQVAAAAHEHPDNARHMGGGRRMPQSLSNDGWLRKTYGLSSK
jgi:hypothetical protein